MNDNPLMWHDGQFHKLEELMRDFYAGAFDGPPEPHPDLYDWTTED